MLKAYRGSPPHARGKDHLVAHQLVHAGITPAYAGKSGPCAFLCPSPEDHPRIRGEKCGPANRPEAGAGSPPHTRGKEDFFPAAVIGLGITPAYAGKSHGQRKAEHMLEDHPRMRGEKYRLLQIRLLYTGSPPHARGKVLFSASSSALPRITPACAGKSRKQ